MEKDVPLGPADYVFTGAGSVPITFAFHYSTPLDPTKMRESLAEALHQFPAIRSVLATTGRSEYVFRMCDAGMDFQVRASADAFEGRRFTGHYASPVESLEGRPLSRITLTQTPDGSVLAASISHALVDGFSYFQFLSTWARLCRGERFLPPDLGREGRVSPEGPGEEPITAEAILDRCGLHLAGSRAGHAGHSPREERIAFSRDQVQSLLAKAKRDEPGASFSENDVMTAWLWKKFLPQWSQGPDELSTHMTCPVDCRRAWKALSRLYFGCALCFACVSVRRGDLATAALGELALRVQGSVRRVTNEFASASMRTLEQFRRQQGRAAMERLHLKHPERGMLVTNLTHMPLRDLDFGAGSPADFLVASDLSGSAALLPAENGITALVLHP